MPSPKGKHVRPPVCDLETWNCDHVKYWLIDIGFHQYANLFSDEHKIDGQALLLLQECDLRLPPLQIAVLGDIKRLSRAINNLVHECESSDSGKGDSSNAEHNNNNNNNNVLPNTSVGALCNGNVTTLNHAQSFIWHIEAPDTPWTGLLKALLACGYCMTSLLLTALIMVIVHDRVPDMKQYPPLPDIFLDNVPLIPWAFQVCEIIACLLALIWCLILFFHKRRLVLFRRMFSLTGTVFALRCVTMLITSLSVPGIHLDCKSLGHQTWGQKLRQAFDIWAGMGLSLRGVRSCGDYMFSGHTTAITLLNHFITEYTPDDWKILSTTTWVLNLFGIFFILAGHEHYSIDVFVAFYLSSRIFLYYHLMANHAIPKASDGRARIWFPLFWFFESGSLGRVPHEYDWPIKFNDVKQFVLAYKKPKPTKATFQTDEQLVDWIENGENNNNEPKDKMVLKIVNSGKKKNKKTKVT